MLNAPSLASVKLPDPFTERRKRRVLAMLWGLFWILMLAIELQDHLTNPYIRWWEPVVWMASSACGGTVWLLLHMRDRAKAVQYLDRPLQWFMRQLKWFPLTAVLFIIAIYAMRHAFYGLLGLEYTHEPWGFVFVYETIKLWLFLGLWLGIIFALETFALWEEQRRRLAALQKSLAEAQLLQLKAQLRPHFLFNALNTISSLMQVDVARADRLLTRLADLLRATLRTDQEELTTVETELQILRLYASIMEERFADRVTLDWQVDPQTLTAMLPSMLLQPLLENAFKHGVERTSVPASILIAARRVENDLELQITNTGEVQPVPGEGLGIRNCRARLNALYGDRAQVQFALNPNVATARVLIPWQESAA
jgi:two-component system LytT family sensor kinase